MSTIQTAVESLVEAECFSRCVQLTPIVMDYLDYSIGSLLRERSQKECDERNADSWSMLKKYVENELMKTLSNTNVPLPCCKFLDLSVPFVLDSPEQETHPRHILDCELWSKLVHWATKQGLQIKMLFRHHHQDSEKLAFCFFNCTTEGIRIKWE